MELIHVDRSKPNHSKYTGAIRLTYDEIVLLNNAVSAMVGKENICRKEEYTKLHTNLRNLEYVVCHGNLSVMQLMESRPHDAE